MNDISSRSLQNRIAKVFVAAALALLGLWIAGGFIHALLWAVIIAVAIDPLYLRAEQWGPGRGHRGLLALGFTCAFALLVIIPIAIGITQAAREAHDIASWVASAQANGVPVPRWVTQLPVGGAELDRWWRANLATPQGADQQLRHLGGATFMTHYQLIGSGLVSRAITFAFTLIALFFLLRDRDSILAQCRNASDRLLGPTGERIALQAIFSVRGTIDGLVLVGIGEGLVMAVVYAVLGVPHPIALGAFTAIAAMIPFGAALIFCVAALLLIAQNAVMAAIAVIVVGLIVVFIADHFVRPALIGGATRLPFLWVLIGILGGVETMGLVGLFAGPATMAVLIMLWREFQHGATSSETTR